MPDTSKFWNRMAKGYSKSAIGDPAAYEEKLRRTRELFTPATEILELGCGTGGTARLHSPYVKHILATDFSTKMISIAKERSKEDSVNNVTFKVAHADDEMGTDAYDVVMAMSLLHLVPNWRELIGQVYSTLRPGGHFVTSTVTMAKGPWWLRLIVALFSPLGLMPKIEFFGADELRREMELAGFEIVDFWQPKSDSVFIIAKRA